MNLNTQNWAEFQILRFFTIHPTKAYKGMSKEDLVDGGSTPVVVNSAVNNGIGGFSSLPALEKGKIITFSDTTEGNTFFYQPYPFIGFAHVQGMYSIDRTWTENELLFLAAMLKYVNSWRYNYGRKMTRDNILKSKVLLPVDSNGDVDWKYMNDYIDSLHHKKITTKVKPGKTPALDTSDWKEFYLHKLFNADMGNGIDAVQTSSGDPEFNYVSRNSNDNGVVGFVDRIEEEEPIPAGSMTLALGGEYLGSTFLQIKPFYTAQNVAILKEKSELSPFVKLFISAIIRNECKIKYQAFGRELNSHYKKDFTLKLPVQKNNKGYVIDASKEYSDEGYIPDWKWMEEYMKSLAYSDRIKF